MTQQRLKELLHYDKNTGVFTRRIQTSNRIKVGDVAGTPHIGGYINITLDSKKRYAHRLAWLYEYGEMPKQIDHINHNKTDNRISNLRNVNQQDNARNMPISRRNKSGFIGVTWNKSGKVWISHIVINGVQKHLGRFKCKREAIETRIIANMLFGFHKNHGILNG